MSNESSYKHVQHAPLCLLIYVLAVVFLVLGLVMNTEPPIPWLFPLIGLFMRILAASFHHLTVEDQGDRLSVSFGPIPLFRRTILHDDIISVEIGRTTYLGGWGIHWSLRGGCRMVAIDLLWYRNFRKTQQEQPNPNICGTLISRRTNHDVPTV